MSSIPTNESTSRTASHHDDLIVIKVGGGKGADLDAVCDELAELTAQGKRFVLVHGGSHETNVISEQLGHPPKFITSPSGHTSRRTDRRTLEIFQMIYCGRINKSAVERLQSRGVNAIGLSGIDGRIWEGQRKSAIRAVEDGRTTIIRDDLSGRVRSVNIDLLCSLLDAGYTPVLTPPAISDDGVAINVDADRAAALTASALNAQALLLLSNIPGLMRDVDDPDSVLEHVDADEIETARQCAGGRMKNKVLAAEETLNGGVPRVVIGDARRCDAIAAALDGRGTVFANRTSATVTVTTTTQTLADQTSPHEVLS